MAEITGDMPIGQIIAIKGEVAGIMLDSILCGDEQKICCPGVTVQLKTALKLKRLDSETLLPQLLNDLNSLPNNQDWNS